MLLSACAEGMSMYNLVVAGFGYIVVFNTVDFSLVTPTGAQYPALADLKETCVVLKQPGREV